MNSEKRETVRWAEPARLGITLMMVKRLREGLQIGWPYRLEDVDLMAALNWAVNGADEETP